jgi:hypothetical protein
MRKALFILAGLLVAGAAIAWRLLHLPDLARIGTGYAAQQTCACLFVSGRSPESCRTDLEPMARWLVSVERGEGQVTARSMGLARAVARYQKGFGCSLEQ